MGTSDFAAEILNYLIKNNYYVVGVVTQPDRLVGRKKTVEYSFVKKLALENDLKIFQPISIKSQYSNIVELNPDLILTCAYGQFLPKEIVDLNVVNIHASILPKYRGGAPMHRAIINGDKYTGITLVKSDIRMDAGPIIATSKVEISLDDTVRTLQEKLIVSSIALLQEYLNKILSVNINYTPQDESQKSIAKIIKPKDEFIDFNRAYKDVYNHIRGLIDWPVGYAYLNKKKLKFHKVASTNIKSNEKSGTIVGFDADSMLVSVDGLILKVYDLQVEGKSKISAKDYKNGVGKNMIGGCFNDNKTN